MLRPRSKGRAPRPDTGAIFMSNTSYPELAAELRARNDALAAAQPGQRARNLAQALEVSEAQWVAAECNGLRATALTGAESPQAVFRELGSLGEVMALTRNEWCVHERHGRYESIPASGPVGLAIGRASGGGRECKYGENS